MQSLLKRCRFVVQVVRSALTGRNPSIVMSAAFLGSAVCIRRSCLVTAGTAYTDSNDCRSGDGGDGAADYCSIYDSSDTSYRRG